MVTRAVIILLLAATLGLPFALRPRHSAVSRADDTVVIITPHNEAIRYEYERGFRTWYQARTGRTVDVDWRVIGGTSEITRFLESEYTAAFRRHWTERLGRPWSAEVQAGFQDGRSSEPTPLAREARETFLKSEVGCGIDVFFGGGTYDFIRQAQAGRIVDSGLRSLRPEWFRDDVIPRVYAGEEFWDREGRWFGTVLSCYGLVFNRDALTRLGIPHEPREWADLTDPRLLGEVALADPTKSSSIAKAFENMVQQQMQRRWEKLMREAPGTAPQELEARAVSEGWLAGLRLVQLAGANARYFTDSSQKPPIDVASGNCAVGLCIDFYGRQQEEAVRRRGSSTRVGYVSPVGGSVASVDPVALMRGAKHRAVAVAFIEYTLSMEGQKLWNFRPGAPGGPERFALRRLPVRKDFYTETSWQPWRTDPEDAPFAPGEQLVYREAWTGGLFRELSLITRVMCHDTHEELVRAWRAINAAPPGRREQALAVLQDLAVVDYARTKGEIKQALAARGKMAEVRLVRELGEQFRAQYARAEAIARGGE